MKRFKKILIMLSFFLFLLLGLKGSPFFIYFLLMFLLFSLGKSLLEFIESEKENRQIKSLLREKK